MEFSCHLFNWTHLYFSYKWKYSLAQWATASAHTHTKGQTWPWVYGAPAYAVGPQPRWRAVLAAAYLAQSAACAGRHRSVEVQNKYQRQVKTVSFKELKYKHVLSKQMLLRKYTLVTLNSLITHLSHSTASSFSLKHGKILSILMRCRTMRLF